MTGGNVGAAEITEKYISVQCPMIEAIAVFFNDHCAKFAQAVGVFFLRCENMRASGGGCRYLKSGRLHIGSEFPAVLRVLNEEGKFLSI